MPELSQPQPERINASEIAFISRVQRINCSYFALIPRELVAKFPQRIGKGRRIKLKLVLEGGHG